MRKVREERNMTLPGSASYFDEVVDEYFRTYQENTPAGYALRVRRQRVLEMLDRPAGKVLDVGCGPGVMAPTLLSMGYEFWGVDAAPRMIELCREHFGGADRAHFSVGGAANLDFPNGFFDTVLCMGVVDCRKEYEAALSEMVRVAKIGGTLLISFPNLVSPYASWKKYVFYPAIALLRPLKYNLVGHSQPPSLYGPGGLPSLPSRGASVARLCVSRTPFKLMASYGAEVTEVTYSYFNPFLSPLDELFPRLALTVTERLEGLRRGKLRWLGAGFIIKAKKRS